MSSSSFPNMSSSELENPCRNTGINLTSLLPFGFKFGLHASVNIDGVTEWNHPMLPTHAVSFIYEFCQQWQLGCDTETNKRWLHTRALDILNDFDFYRHAAVGAVDLENLNAFAEFFFSTQFDRRNSSQHRSWYDNNLRVS